jgi:O-antigen ligase
MFSERKLVPRKAIPILTAGLFAAVVSLMVFHSAVFTRFSPSARLEAQSIDMRAGEYGQVLEVIKTNPVTGVGVGQYTLALAHQYPGGSAWVYQPMHNAFLLIVAEIGLFGFALTMGWVSSIILLVWKKRKTANGMFAIGLGSLIGVLALLDHYVWSSWSGLALMAVSFAIMVRWSLESKMS